MRLSFIFIFAALMQVSASSLAQKITLSERQATLETILQKIRLQTGYDFLYDVQAIKAAKPIDINVRNSSLTDALNSCLVGQDFSFTIDDKSVIIKRKEPSFLDHIIIARFTDIDVRGRVVDEQGNPLPNASIQVKGKSQVYNSNDKGEFVMANVPDDGVLVIRYVGYKQLEIALKDAVMPLEIKLNVATGELEEVKVTYSTGYQNIPKERATGSFVQLSNEDINRTVSTNILDRIKYITSGLKDGPLDGNRDISIRGLSTINANKIPLIVIDGFPYEEDAILTINNLNPNDIESITILKDAAAASIWGARSANGVIVMNTKKGRFNQKSSIQLNTSLNIAERPDLFNVSLISSADAIEYEKKMFASGLYDSYNGPFTSTYSYPAVSTAVEIMLAQKRGAITQTEAESQLNKLSNHDVRNDINKYLLRPTVNQQYNLNISGGSDKMAYYGSIGYDGNDESAIRNQYKRITLRFDNTYRPLKKLELRTFIAYTQNKTQANGVSNYNQFLRSSPYTMLADENGKSMHFSPSGLRTGYVDTLKIKGMLDWHYRPLDEVNNNDNTSNLFDVRFGGGIKYSIIAGLDINVSGQYEKSLTNINNYYNIQNYFTRNLINQFMFLNPSGQPQYPIPQGGILDYANQSKVAYNFRGTLNFNKIWVEHSISSIAGIDISDTELDSYKSRKYGYNPLTLTWAGNMDFNTRFNTRPTGNGIIFDGGDLNGNLNRSLNYYGNIAYTFLNKYTFSTSGRIDASNFFGVKANLKAKPFWSVGTAWDIKKENFFKLKEVSSLKLRATYGYNGNLDNTATSRPTITYQAGSTPYNNSQVYATRSTPPNPGLTWEKVRMINLGLDFGLFNNRLNGFVEYYAKKATNLIGSTIVDPTVGVSQYVGNYASLKGKGLDLTLNALIVNRELNFTTSINFSYNVDEITDYYLPATILTSGSNYVNLSLPFIGKPLNSIYSYKWAGLNALTGDPMGIVNGQIVPFTTVLGSTGGNSNTKPEDLIYNGRANPSFFGNFINTISYKGISASINITYAFGYYFKAPSVDYNSLQTTWSAHGDYALRWRNPGDELITNVPSMPVIADNRYSFYSNSEILVKKGDHIRLQDFRVSYNLNKHTFKYLPFNHTSIFINFNNIGLILWRDNKEGIDPNFVDRVPTPKSIALGLTLNY